MDTFKCPLNWLDKKINIILVGAGGTGSNALDALSSLHHGLVAVGHKYGLMVTLFDDDLVESANIGRQRFTPADIGNNKATTLINRYNIAYGLNWESAPTRFDRQTMEAASPDLLITCVDTIQTRTSIAENMCKEEDNDAMWLDFGNGRHSGQVVLGGLSSSNKRLPNVYDLYPELDDMQEDNTPSCSLAEAIQKQDLFVNRTIVDAGINLIWQLLRYGELNHHGVFINQKTSEVKPLMINTDVWKFMGYKPTQIKKCKEKVS